MFDGVAKFFAIIMILLVLALPFAIWKLIEVIIWLFEHISIVIN